MVSRNHFSSSLLVSLCALGFATVGIPAAQAACPANTGAVGVPAPFWGRLQPTDVVSVPGDRDTTEYVGGNQTTDWKHPLFSSLDVEGGYVFTSYAFGLHVWDATGENAADPKLRATRDQGKGEFLENIGYQEQRWLMWDIDAPPGNSNLVALSGIAPFGLAVWDTTNKSAPKILYQDTGRTAYGVFSTTLGGRHYAFAASNGVGAPQQGLLMYDLSAAKERYGSAAGCKEDSSASTSCGVFKQRLGPADGFQFVDGFTTAAGRTFVVATGGFGYSAGVKLWEVTNPSSPVDLGRVFSTQALHGVAAWEQGGRQFLAVQQVNGNARIHEITGCLDGGCSNPPQLWASAWPATLKPFVRWLTYSQGGDGTGYLYVGTEHGCIEEVQGEWIYDLSHLTSGGPEEITPPHTEVIGGKQVGYWSHYYPTRSTGFNRVHPRVGKVNGTHFYRAAWTLFDVHQLTDVDPTITVTGPANGYLDTAAAFTATALACTPDPGGWGWSTDGGTGAGLSATANLTWSALGTKTVSATNTGCPGATVVPAAIQVLDPAPALANVSASPNPVLVCQTVTLTANTVTGKPPLTYAWTVTGPDPTPGFTSANTNPIAWNIPSDTLPGTYTAAVTITGTGPPAGDDVTVEVLGLPDLQFTGDAKPTEQSVDHGSVQLTIAGKEQGATEWIWDFGDAGAGDCGAGFTEIAGGRCSSTNPAVGPVGKYVYKATGTYDVTVTIDNCVEEPITSNAEPVIITQVAPLLIVTFQAAGANCVGGACLVDKGQPVPFTVVTSGNPTSWSVVWGDGSTSSGPGSPVGLTHTYNTVSTFTPTLTITRGSESKDKTHPNIVVANPSPPSINVAGPASGQPNQSMTFTASASNCSVAANGWSWSVTGVSVADTDNQISVSFPSVGSKTVTAQNSACGSTQGSRSVSISEPGGGGGGGGGSTLKANFTFSPAAPAPGTPVTFDAGPSTGANLAYYWELPGKTAIEKVVTHTFTQPGTYPVKLSVSQLGCLSASCPSDTITKNVTVAGPSFLATFSTSVSCTEEFGIVYCPVQTGQKVDFTGTTAGATQHTWDFGDGTTGTGAAVSHAWTAPGPFTMTYTASNGTTTAAVTRSIVVTGAPIPKKKSVVLPWIAQTRGVLVQSSDLYLHNPGEADLPVVVTLRERGTPSPNPATAALTIKPHETLFYGDVISELFHKENVTGFITVVTEGDGPAPIITSFNSTTQDGGKFGQAVSGSTVSAATEAATLGERLDHLVGLNATTEKLAYVGVSNPNDAPATYRLRFFDKLGQKVGETEDIVLARFGQQQFQSKALAANWGINDLDDYRVEVQTVAGAQLFPYGANVRVQSADPSYVGGAKANQPLVHLVGVFGTKGLNNSVWQTDVVLGNSSDQVVITDVTFRAVGTTPPAYDTVPVTLQPRETKRIENVLQTLWGLSNTVGVLTFESDSPSGVYPTILAEVYDNANPGKRFGQSMAARALEAGAAAGQSQHLIGLRQESGQYRSTVSLFNAGTDFALYDLVYRELDGDTIQTIANLQLGPGKLRQINPGAHPLPAGGLANGFSVEVKVKAGKILAGAQVINDSTNDPAYILGETR